MFQTEFEDIYKQHMETSGYKHPECLSSVLMRRSLLVIFCTGTHLVTPIPLFPVSPRDGLIYRRVACPFFKGDFWHFEHLIATYFVFAGDL